MMRLLSRLLSEFSALLLELLHRVLWCRGTVHFLNYVLELRRGVFSPTYTVSTSLVARYLTSQKLQDREKLRVGVDLGTGSGALALVLGRICEYVVATDISRICCVTAHRNLQRYHIYHDVILCCGASVLRTGTADLVLTNPPYLPVPPRTPFSTSYSCLGPDLVQLLRDLIRVGRRYVLTTISTLTLSYWRSLRKLLTHFHILTCTPGLPGEKVLLLGLVRRRGGSA